MPDDIADAEMARQASSAASRNLQQRVVSGVVMVLVSSVLVYSGPVATALMVLVVALVMTWEWGHLIRTTSADAAFWVHAASVVGAIGLVSCSHSALALIAVLVGTVLVLLLTLRKLPVLSAVGVPYVGLSAMALVLFRQDVTHGFAAVIFLLLIVITTDTMAFVFGRTIGGAKLWPAVSPNKTWAGFLGGVGSSALVGAGFSALVSGASPLRLGLIGLLLGIIAQGGDLAESALKRLLGVKDASSIIPGHGGVMDRMDGVVSVAIVAAIYALIVSVNAPAVALLVGGR